MPTGVGLAIALLLGACGGGEPDGTPREGDHKNLACAACHQGDVADSGMPAVPRSTCASSGCHRDRIPREIRLSTVTFQHRSHGAESEVALGCAGCHTHQTGAEPLMAGVDACGLCHARSLSGESGQDCAECHGQPEVVTVTSQGVPVPHQGLPWISRSCVRCHYDVSHPPPRVPASRCRSCHDDVDATAARAVGRDLHPGHAGVTCVSCHEARAHRIVAMSSAVSLECASCHRRVHDVNVPPEWPSENCNACHRGSHESQQRLFLGLAGRGLDPTPSEKFMDGLVCRSCHVPSLGAEAADAITGNPRSCVACHEARYASVLRWWTEGLEEREGVVSRYLEQARVALGRGAQSDSAEVLLDDARALLALVRDAGGQHNLRLSHRLFTESLERASRAYRRGGLNPPEKPYLGRQPSMGICSYCHYRLNDPMEFQQMPADFHLRVMGRR